MKTNRILILGNSITRHAPAPHIGWLSDCGMAASALEKDYAHLFLQGLASPAGLQPEARILNIAAFEREFDTFDIAAKLEEEIAFKADLVIVAIGENVPALADADMQGRFKARLLVLLAAVKSRPDAMLFVRSCFWPDAVKDEILRQACAAMGGHFVDISALGQDESNYARAERKFSDAGVAAHPGDKGMRAIADAILSACLAPEVALNRQWAEQVFAESAGSRLPFSFVYGGRPSSTFLRDWPRTVAVDRINATTLRRTLTLTDPETRLEVKAVCSVYTDTPGADWTLILTNNGEVDTPPIEALNAVDAALTPGTANPVVVHRLNGAPSAVDDWLPYDQPLPPGGRVAFGATNGRSSNVSPFFNVAWGKGGVITAIGWSGQWTAAIEHKDGQLRTQVAQEFLHTVLRPGESIRSPRILQLQWTGADPNRGYNLFRQTMMAHIMPRIGGELVMPPVVHTSTAFYELNKGTEENVLSHLDACKGLGFEMFWLDAYWTGPNGFPDSMGNYGFPIERVEPKDKYPNGLKAIGEAVKQAGLGFVLWFEPERVAPNTLLAREHADWVIPGASGQGLFNLGLPAARQFMTDYLNAAVKAYGVSCLRFDYNIDPLTHWQSMDKDPDRVGLTEMRYVEGLYQMWDDIAKANPKLFIDNCASGGRRIDLETCSRSIALWRSDNTCDMIGDNADVILLAAIKNQVMSAGLNRYVPWSTVGQMGADPYRFRSAFNGGIVFGQDIRPKDYPRALLQQGIAEGKRLRKYWLGDFYPLSEVTTSANDWLVMQYHRPGGQDGIVLAFRRQLSPACSYACHLQAIDPTARYQVTLAHSYAPESPVTLSGAELQRLQLDIPDCPGSVLLEYRKVE